MDADFIRAIGGSLLSALLGGLIVHLAARRRDVENDRRKQRIDYLIGAYQVLVRSAHRSLEGERAESFENAISDVILLGNNQQIELARELIRAFAEDHGASVDDLLVSLRKALRHELGLQADPLSEVPTIRLVTAERSRPDPLTLAAAAEVRFDDVSASTARNVLSVMWRPAKNRNAGPLSRDFPVHEDHSVEERLRQLVFRVNGLFAFHLAQEILR